MDYSSPSQFDRHWAQRVQKEQKAFQNQSNGFNTLKTHNDTHDFMKMQEEPVEFHEERSGGKAKDYSTIKSFKASSCSSRSSNSVNTFSSKSKLSSKHGSSSKQTTKTVSIYYYPDQRKMIFFLSNFIDSKT
mmetsp:Transcript_28721/g.25424  ORF Transcript_28721/g.25424 Transcript_28721/m.25424 type:complete len:132 (-) Transcript_28721:250-645(-)